MNCDSLNVTTSLSVECVELYTTNNSTLKLATKGPLNLLYIQAYNCFILQINDFRYSLYETIPILASLQETNCIRSYVIPNVNGNYIIKVTTTTNLKVLDDLEAIFKKNSRLAYKTRSSRHHGETSTEITDLDDIQCNIDEDASPKSAFARPQRNSMGSPLEIKSPKKTGLFRSLFSKKSKKLSESAPGKNMSKSDAALFRNPLLINTPVTSLDKNYVQGLIMMAKEIGRKAEENNRNIVKSGSSSGNEPEVFQFAAEETRQYSSETFYGMDQSLSFLNIKPHHDTENRLIGF